MRLAYLIAAIAWLCLAGAAEAQDLSTLCNQVGDVQVGQWAEYEMKGGGKDGTHRMRLAIIGAKPGADETAYWVEMKMAGKEGEMITQVLVSGYPYQPDDIEEMVMKAGKEPAMKMPRQMLGMMRGRMPKSPTMGDADRCGQARVVGWESVVVPAGEFRALHFEPVDSKANVWATQEVPFGMVKVVDEKIELVLLAHGKDAKSSISETPVSMPGMGGR